LPVQLCNFQGAFGHSSQPNIKHIWSTIITKQLPNTTECNHSVSGLDLATEYLLK